MKCNNCGKRGLKVVKYQTEDGQIHTLGEKDGEPHSCPPALRLTKRIAPRRATNDRATNDRAMSSLVPMSTPIEEEFECMQKTARAYAARCRDLEAALNEIIVATASGNATLQTYTWIKNRAAKALK